jgi:hypothetical protein
MDEARPDRQPDRRRARSYPIAALLALFVGAAVLALASRLLPRGLAHLARGRHRGADARDLKRG